MTRSRVRARDWRYVRREAENDLIGGDVERSRTGARAVCDHAAGRHARDAAPYQRADRERGRIARAAIAVDGRRIEDDFGVGFTRRLVDDGEIDRAEEIERLRRRQRQGLNCGYSRGWIAAQEFARAFRATG